MPVVVIVTAIIYYMVNKNP